MSDFHGGPHPPQQPGPFQPQYTPQGPEPRLPDPGQPEKPKKQPAPRRHTNRTLVLTGIGSLVLGLVIGASGSSDSATDAAASSTPTTAVSSTKPDNGPTPDPVTTPTNKPSPKPTVAPKTTEKPKPVVYKKLTAREWAKIAKSPDKHVGEAYIVHGVVTQFDSATGDDQFRADVDGVKHLPEYGYVDYPTNTLMTNIAGDLSDLVQDDLFTAKVMVLGSYSYDTQIGGETTVPQLTIASITVTGSVK